MKPGNKRINPETGKYFKKGDTRKEDDLVFLNYRTKRKDKKGNCYEDWVTKENLPAYLNYSTGVCQEAVRYWLSIDSEMLQESAYLASQSKKWSKMKKRLVGYGKNKNFGGGTGHKRPSYRKSQAAPPDFAVLEEQEEDKKSIKVKIAKKKV